MTGQTAVRADISAMTNASPCVITTVADHGYNTLDFVRITDINGSIPVPRGMNPINDHKYRVVKIDDTSFSLEDPITFEKINSTNFPPYIEGGYCNLVEQNFIYNGD
jgi:hypothetical protein